MHAIKSIAKSHAFRATHVCHYPSTVQLPLYPSHQYTTIPLPLLAPISHPIAIYLTSYCHYLMLLSHFLLHPPLFLPHFPSSSSISLPSVFPHLTCPFYHLLPFRFSVRSCTSCLQSPHGTVVCCDEVIGPLMVLLCAVMRPLVPSWYCCVL